MKSKKLSGNLVLLFVSTLLCFSVAEYFFRSLIFGDHPNLETLRDPMLYSDYFSADHEKLRVLFNQGAMTDKLPHPVFGWLGDFDADTFLHNKSGEIKGRRPVLLYGDSFGRCSVWEVECFEHILNAEEDFAKDNYLLNFSRGNYGVDQIFLTMKHTLDHYEKPFVVFTLMTLDLDRAILKLRPQPKPYFEIRGEELRFHPPAAMNMYDYVEENPPEILSYLWNYLYFKVMRLAEKKWHWLYRRMHDSPARRKKVLELNARILEEALRTIQERELDYLVVIFQPNWRGVSSFKKLRWREQFLVNFFEERKVPYLFTRDLILAHAKERGNDIHESYILNDGHPNLLYNKLVSAEIKKAVLASQPSQSSRRIRSELSSPG